MEDYYGLNVPSAKGMQGFATYPLSHVIVFPEPPCCKAKKRKEKERKERKEELARTCPGCLQGGWEDFSKEGARIAERGVGTSVADASGRSTLSINSPVASQ